MLLHADADRYYPLAVIVSLLLHVAIVGVGAIRWSSEPERRLVVPVDYVRATLIELEQRTPQVDTPRPDVVPQRNLEQERAQELEEQKRLAERQRLDEQRRFEEQRAAEAKRLAEQKLAEERAAEQKRLEELERLEQLRQQELAQRLQQEQQAAANVANEQMVASFVGAFQDQVRRNWSRPPSARNGMTAFIRVTLVPNGSVVSAEIVQSSGDEAFDRSALQAIGKAEPFEFLQDVPIATFEQRFRHFQFEFSPQDLRL